MDQVESTVASDESDVNNACVQDCKDCVKMKEDMKKLEESMKRKQEKMKRAEGEIRSLKRTLEDKTVQLEYNERYNRRLEKIIDEGNEELKMYKYKTSMLEGELRSKDKLVLELSDKRVRLSRSVHWLEHKTEEQWKRLEKVEAEKVKEEQMRHEIQNRSKVRKELLQ